MHRAQNYGDGGVAVRAWARARGEGGGGFAFSVWGHKDEYCCRRSATDVRYVQTYFSKTPMGFCYNRGAARVFAFSSTPTMIGMLILLFLALSVLAS